MFSKALDSPVLNTTLYTFLSYFFNTLYKYAAIPNIMQRRIISIQKLRLERSFVTVSFNRTLVFFRSDVALSTLVSISSIKGTCRSSSSLISSAMFFNVSSPSAMTSSP
eukprot:Gb_30060 [translate_table: standard]